MGICNVPGPREGSGMCRQDPEHLEYTAKFGYRKDTSLDTSLYIDMTEISSKCCSKMGRVSREGSSNLAVGNPGRLLGGEYN